MRTISNYRLFTVTTGIIISILILAPEVYGSQDILISGQSESEQQHKFKSGGSKLIQGLMGVSARKLLPKDPPEIYGHSMSFTMKCDPCKPNYFTIKLSGSDAGEELGRLVLFCEGKQVGWNHLGFIDQLNIAGEEPYFNGRFFYKTLPLPVHLTRGRHKLNLKVRSMGRIWGYGRNIEQYYKPLNQPTRGIYRVYVHTDNFFAPPEQEKQGQAVVNPPVRKKPGVEILDKLKNRVNREINKLLQSNKTLNQMQMQFLAKAYYVEWSDAYRNKKVVEECLNGLDNYFQRFHEDRKLAQSDPATYNPGWFGFGPAGNTVRLLVEQFEPVLDEKIDNGKGNLITRRKAWSSMLQYSRDWHSRHRRQYTNQSMIVDLNIYAANAGVRAIDPANASPEKDMLGFLYESIGLKPWLGSLNKDGEPAKPLGDDYWQLTDKGLTKELGYVGNYGEVLDWVKKIYDITRIPGEQGDEKIKKQLEKIMNARAVFRYPMLDPEGNRAMRLETVVGWRDDHYPGRITYIERVGWDSSPLGAAAVTQSKKAIGYAQQMFEDNQFFNAVKNQMEHSGFRVTASLLPVPDHYEILKDRSPSPYRLPMAGSQPDFVWADEENGVLAVNNGDEILYASLYWRARYAINNMARIHYITPKIDRIAVVRQQSKFDHTGDYYTIPNRIDKEIGWADIDPPNRNWDQAMAGVKLPVAKTPPGIEQPPVGEENPYVGRSNFYRCRYGKYLIGMNCTKNKTYQLKVPEEWKSARELSSGKSVSANQSLTVKPMSTVVIYQPE